MNKSVLWFSTMLLLGIPSLTHTQTPTPSAAFALWKDNCKATYTIVHDDFGDVTTVGITKYADTVASQRGIKFVFGAITNACDTHDWADARRMITHGHEIINHSHSHRCAVNTGWCTDVYSSADYHLELDTSTALIERGSGHRPRFFIHPYDLYNDTILNHLKLLKYLGARSGYYSQLNSPHFLDPFRLNFFVFEPSSTLAQLNSTVDAAIADGSYAVRELHGVQDASWGKVTLSNYRTHLDYVKTKMNAKQLWTATFSEVVTYKMQREAFLPKAAFDRGTNILTVRFDTLKSIDTMVLKTPVSVNVLLDGLKYEGGLYVTQNGISITDFTSSKDTITLNVYPHRGAVQISGKFHTCEPNCPPPPCRPNGQLIDQVWRDVQLDYWQMRDFTNDSRYPNLPTQVDTLKNTTFFRTDLGDSYGQRVVGYLVPRETGNFTFTLTSDDDSELYLGLNHLPATKRKVAGFQGYTGPNEYTKFAGQNSAPIHLDSGKYYYVELLHFATVGDNPFRVFWRTPSNSTRALIGAHFLSSEFCSRDSFVQHLHRNSFSLELTGRVEHQEVILDWEGACHAADDYYEIKRRQRDGSFKTIDMVNAEQHQRKIKWFRYRDVLPQTGDNDYQIQLVQHDGKKQNSNIVHLNLQEPGTFRAYPNPAQHYLMLDLNHWEDKMVKVFIYNSTGRLLFEQEFQAGIEHRFDIPSHWQSGQYTVRVRPIGIGQDKVKTVMIIQE